MPHTRHVPVQPILLEGEKVYAMFEDLTAYPWVLGIYRYVTPEVLIANLGEQVIGPAEAKALELRGVKPPG